MFLLSLVIGCAGPDVRPLAEEKVIGARFELVGAQPVGITLASAQVEESPLQIQGVEVAAVAGDANPVEISGASSRWDLDSGKVEFEGNVRLVQGGVELHCSQLEAKYSGKSLEAATATGEVTVRKDGAVATGERAVWDAAQGSITLTGGPILEDESRRLRGEQIVFFLDERRLECKYCSLIIDAPGLE